VAIHQVGRIAYLFVVAIGLVLVAREPATGGFVIALAGAVAPVVEKWKPSRRRRRRTAEARRAARE
jgi:hypothetical protein